VTLLCYNACMTTYTLSNMACRRYMKAWHITGSNLMQVLFLYNIPTQNHAINCHFLSFLYVTHWKSKLVGENTKQFSNLRTGFVWMHRHCLFLYLKNLNLSSILQQNDHLQNTWKFNFNTTDACKSYNIHNVIRSLISLATLPCHQYYFCYWMFVICLFGKTK